MFYLTIPDETNSHITFYFMSRMICIIKIILKNKLQLYLFVKCD